MMFSHKVIDYVINTSYVEPSFEQQWLTVNMHLSLFSTLAGKLIQFNFCVCVCVLGLFLMHCTDSQQMQ